MARRKTNPLHPLAEVDSVREAAAALVKAVQEAGSERSLAPKSYAKAIRDVERLRGRPLMYPMLTAGAGYGARVRLADGTVKLDFVGGIGVYAFGHGDTDLLECAVIAAASDVLFQGHLMPGPEYLNLSKALLRNAGPRLKHAWLSLSGAIANENALKMIFQRNSPADHIVVFDRGFHGRTVMLADLTDRPAFREGLPRFAKVLHVPFYEPDDPESMDKSLAKLQEHIERHPGQIAGFCMELIQGEGGFHTAPPEFFEKLMTRCREADVAVWVDEVQTYARTGELFAFKTLGLENLVDLVTVGKSLQGSAVLYCKEYNPRPGLVAGTYAGNTVGMAMGTRIIERLEQEHYLGPEGRIAVLGRRIEKRFESLGRRIPKAVGPRSGMGAMQAFVPFDGSAEVAKAVLQAAFEEGLILLSAGSNPTKIRMLPPVNTTDEELESGFTMLEKALHRVQEEQELSC